MATGPVDAQGDPRNPHDLAVDIQTDLHKLATYLTQAGAAPAAVSQLSKMAEIIGEVVKALGAQPEAAGPPQQVAAAQPPPQQQPAPGPQQAAPQPPEQQVQRHTLHSASHALHAAMIASAASRRAQGQ